LAHESDTLSNSKVASRSSIVILSGTLNSL
jgi:hypothetical protein